MGTPTTNRLVMIGLSATATAAILAYGILENRVPDKTYQLKLNDESKSWEECLKTPYYSMAHAEMQVFNQIKILNNFASNLLENSVNIDPLISKIINENFSKLF